jgi:predicted RNA binding protein YcfA (HicA-like mRNA interferase family)
VQDEKLVDKILADQSHITVEDCDRLLTVRGFEYRKSSGSHRAYHKKGERPIIVIAPHSSKYLKQEYVDKLIKRLNLEK